ncbi:hypothetical protein LRAMOSA10079 [Lichtheimia ramosa]|uniref:Uncharacterized protein n=1 Tax=Lichtheimia ramosa TaxID=688394 RepID=A0A077WNN4_9FUNG|nr:hypothetical protein LRAMOSA10079 [Lichtheimia ramosa]
MHASGAAFVLHFFSRFQQQQQQQQQQQYHAHLNDKNNTNGTRRVLKTHVLEAKVYLGGPVVLKRYVLFFTIVSHPDNANTNGAPTTLAALLNNKRLWFSRVVCRLSHVAKYFFVAALFVSSKLPFLN